MDKLGWRVAEKLARGFRALHESIKAIAKHGFDKDVTKDGAAQLLWLELNRCQKEATELLAMYDANDRAALSEKNPSGWKLVPVEPTKHMDATGCNEDERYSNNRFSYPSESRAYNVWRAMLDAAPANPTEKKDTA